MCSSSMKKKEKNKKKILKSSEVWLNFIYPVNSLESKYLALVNLDQNFHG